MNPGVGHVPKAVFQAGEFGIDAPLELIRALVVEDNDVYQLDFFSRLEDFPGMDNRLPLGIGLARGLGDAALDLGDLLRVWLCRLGRAQIDEQPVAESTYLEGVHAVLEQPEFAEHERMLDAIQHLAAYELYRVVVAVGESRPGQLSVVIGGENEDSWMQDWSVVVSAYGEPDGPAGTIAVIGPMRMHYARTIPRVRYVAELMSELIHEVVS